MIEIGGDAAWKQCEIGNNIVLVYQWICLEPDVVGATEDPALFICRKAVGQHRLADGTCPYMIPMAHAHQWARPDGYPELSTAVPGAIEIAETLGFTVEKSIVNFLVDAVLDAIPDLLYMPPKPKYLREIEAAAEAARNPEAVVTLKVDGKTVLEESSRDKVMH